MLALSPPPTSVQVSIVSQSVTLCHHKDLSPALVQSTLEYAGFDVLTDPSSIVELGEAGPSSFDRRKKHIQQCSLCQQEALGSGSDSIAHCQISSGLVNAENTTDPDLAENGPFRVTLSIGGMTCSACSGTIMKMVSGLHGVSDVAVSLLSKSATVIVNQKELANIVAEAVEDCGFEAEVLTVESLSTLECDLATGPRTLTLHVDGMFCQ